MSRHLFSASRLLQGIAVLLCSVWTSHVYAVITYVDATDGPGGNSTLLDGSEWTTTLTATGPVDNEWSKRAFANGGTIFEASIQSTFSTDGITENAHTIRTTISGLDPGGQYNITGYFWSTTGNWRLEGSVDPADLDDNGTPGSVLDDFLPGVPGVSFSYLADTPDATFAPAADASRFDASVLVVEGNRTMYEAGLGLATADGSGQVHVYIDDWENDSNVRTWYDGVGFELVEATIDRTTGELVINSPTARSIVGYSIQSPSGTLSQADWTSIADAYDATATGPHAGMIDPDDSWMVLSEAGSTTDLSEGELNLSGPRDGGTLPANTSISFGEIWRPYFTEDVTLDLLLSDGTVEQLAVVFTGNSGMPYTQGDLDFNGSIGPEDFEIFISSFYSPISGSVVEAYALGDLTQDIAVDYDDLVAFRKIYDQANGAGAFQALTSATSVPEPGTSLTLLLAGAACLTLRTRRFFASMVAIILMSFSGSAMAQITYVDAVPDNLDGAPPAVGVTNTTLLDGTAWGATATRAADGLYALRSSGTWGNDGIYESNANGAEDSPILITTVGGLDPTERYLTYGFFWSNPNENWRLKITNDPADIDDNGTPGDLLDDFLPNDPSVSFSANGSPTSTTATNIAASAFDGPVVVGTNPALYVAELGIHSPNGSGEIAYYVDDLENQGSAQSRTWYDGVGFWRVLDLTLEINTFDGSARIKNESGETIDMGFYKITSSNNELNPAGWSTLDMQNIDAVDGDDPGTDAGDSVLEGWDMGGGSNSGLLTEVNFLSTTGLTDQATFSLGTAFMPGVTEGVTFEFESQQGLMTGLVEFINEASLPGDYDKNGTVEMNDYLTWKADFGTSGLDLDSDGNGDGQVNLADYTVWRNNLGASLPPGSLAAQAVPEPATWLVALACLVGISLRRVQLLRVPVTMLLAGLFTVGLSIGDRAWAEYTLDRQYLLGDDSLEGGNPGDVVGSMNTGALGSGNSADTYGPVSGSYLDVVVGGTPEYVNVDTVGGGRPLTSSANSQGVVFDGMGDYLDGIPLNRPDELALILATADTPSTYPINYEGITARGMQMWVYPEQAGIDAGGFQSIVSDSIQAGGPAIDENGNWSQMNSRHFANISTGPEATAPVVGDTWYHVMQHIYVDGEAGALPVVAGGAPLGFTAVLYVDGIAVSANNDSQSFTREYQEGPPLVVTSNPQPDYDHRLVIGASELPNPDTEGARLYGNFFDGVIDDLEMYVYGNNETGTPGVLSDGEDWGTFDLFADNAWIANEIATDPALGGSLQNGDLDRDGDIDADDIAAFVDGWLSRKEFVGAHRNSLAGDWETWTWGDLDHDGQVYLSDLYLMHEALQGTAFGGFNTAWLQGASIQVPEPSTCVLVVAGIAALGGARLRRRQR